MRVALIILLLSITPQAFAISIIRYDYIRFEDNDYRLENIILESFFQKHKEIDLKIDEYWMNNARNYTAKFVLSDSKLYLTEVIVGRNNANGQLEHVNVISEIFRNKTKVHMDCLSTTLILKPKPDYSQLGSVKPNKFIQIDIINGNQHVVKRLSYEELNQLRKKKYNSFIKTAKYTKLLDKYREIENRSILASYSPSYIKERTLETIFDLTTKTKKLRTRRAIIKAGFD